MRTRYLIPVLTVVTAMSLSGCVNNSQAASSMEASGRADDVEVSKNDSIAAMLPENVKTAGVLNVGMANNYPPNEFKDANGAPTGWSVDLTRALGEVLGLKVSFDIGTFDNVLPTVTSGRNHIGVSSFTDTPERQEQVDFVNYYSAGIQWAAPKGKTVDPDNACGLKVAVQAATYQDTHEVPAKSKACTDAGKRAIEIFRYDAQDQATNALAVGQVDAMSADSPVTLYAVSKTRDKLQTAGDPFDVAPYGMPVAKDSALTPAIQGALQALIDDGTYNEILAKWGVESGGVQTATLNVGSKG
jgi:polar amino acid transport system substrate-binding protein